MELKRDHGEWFNFVPFKLVAIDGRVSRPLCMCTVHRDRIWFDYILTATVEEGGLSSEVVYQRRYKTWGDMLHDLKTVDTRGINLNIVLSSKL